MDMSLPRNSSLLEKWLEDMPNSNNDINVKKERKDFRDIFPSNSFISNNFNTSSVSLSSNSLHSTTNATIPSVTTQTASNSKNINSINSNSQSKVSINQLF
jgi:hypothetical protein